MNISEKIYDLNLEISIIMRKIAKDLGLTLSQVQLLLSIPFSSISMTELANLLGIDNSTLTRNLNKLEKKGYVKRTKDYYDRRIYKISLSKKGSVKKNIIENKLNEVSIKILSVLNYKDKHDVFQSLEKLSWVLTKIRHE
ncbi:MAG: MarR family transcriptional regulator [Candidatus Neomarinimicrobiota bacterium]|nr:MarR family transcriptional regulator [Candidatus Neomarinimicrobiota bacterium]